MSLGLKEEQCNLKPMINNGRRLLFKSSSGSISLLSSVMKGLGIKLEIDVFYECIK